MPTTFAETYLPLLIQFLLATGLAAALVFMGWFLGQRVRNRVKDSPYECGAQPVGSAKERFSIKFYLVAMIFILFDIEAIFLFPWAVVYRELGLFGFVVMFLFIDVVLTGFFYIWKKGVLNWGTEPPRAASPGIPAIAQYTLTERT
jgi:NADH-quinone oxidoreductase subunit A